MNKNSIKLLLLMIICFAFSGCSTIESKTASMSVIYGATTFLSFLMLMGYCCFIQKREAWFLLLFTSVMVVNIGYFALSISSTLEEALLANRISYLGSVFLPMAMLMIILNVSKLNYQKWIPGILISIAILIFFIAASPGYLDIYYKSVSFEKVNGVSMLVKEYGSWHVIYLFYLLGYFAMMIGATIRAILKKKIDSPVHITILITSVMINIGVWLLEQLVKIDFEVLSVSYIITEMFLLGLYMMLQNQENIIVALKSQIIKPSINPEIPSTPDTKKDTPDFLEHVKFLEDHISTLTPTERIIYGLYLDGKGTKDIMTELNISENTLKYHNKNIYGKLGVSSRKQLLEYATVLNKK